MIEKTGNELPGEGVDEYGELSGDIRKLIGVLRESNVSADRLTLAVEADGRRRDFWTKVILTFVAVVVILVLVMLVRQGASADRGISIKDCVTPGGTCYRLAQQQKAADRQRDVVLAVAVATCSTSAAGDATKLNTCVRDALTAADTPSRTSAAPGHP